MRLIPRESIIVSDRQRSEIDSSRLEDLKLSIESRGLLHPPVVCGTSASGYRLVAGERRLRAIDALAESDSTFWCDQKLISPGEVPVLFIQDLPVSDIFTLEFEENELREALSWQDRMRAIDALHKLRKEENPDQTFKTTAIEINEKLPTPRSVTAIAMEVSTASIVTRHLSDPDIQKARNEREALQLSLKKEHARYHAELIKRRVAVARPSLQCELRHGDALEIMPRLDEGRYDLILTDPPYGISAGGQGFRDRTVHHHNYNDSPDYARTVLRAILTEGWRLCKSSANLFLFTDISHFHWLQEFSAQMGWTPWRFPVIWQKSESEGLVPWSRQGFAHTFDIIFFATKGQRGLLRTHVDILNFPRVRKEKRVHAAEKPLDLLSLLIDLSTLPGDWVFDPCAGSGSTLLAAKRLKRHSFGLEIDRDTADEALVKLDSNDENEADEESAETVLDAGPLTEEGVSF